MDETNVRMIAVRIRYDLEKRIFRAKREGYDPDSIVIFMTKELAYMLLKMNTGIFSSHWNGEEQKLTFCEQPVRLAYGQGPKWWFGIEGGKV